MMNWQQWVTIVCFCFGVVMAFCNTDRQAGVFSAFALCAFQAVLYSGGWYNVN